MKRIIIVISVIILILCINKNQHYQEETIRFRIIANSNEEVDQELKKEIVYNLADIINKNQESKSIKDTRNYIKENIPEFNKVVEETLKNNHANRNYRINYGLNYFPKKELYNKEYEEGEYESLVIELGDAKGDNFWCVLFPPLCMIEKDNNYEYKSFFKELINKYF